MNNYSHPIIASAGWPLQVNAFSLFSAVAVYSVVKSMLATIHSHMNVDLLLEARPEVIVSDKVSVSEMILAGF